jgi:transposase
LPGIWEPNHNTLYRWRRQLREHRDDAFAGHGKTKPGDDAVARLRRELARVKGELDIFETAIPFFATGYR